MAYDGFYLTYKSDKETNERFDRVQKKYPNFRMVKINLEDWSDPKIDKAIMKIADVTNTKHFWIIDPDVNVDDSFNFNFETDSWDDNITHVWNAEERNVFRSVVGVKLFKTSDVKKKKTPYIQDAYFLTGDFKEHKSNQVEYKPTTETYDIFYWKKDYGNANFEKLKERFPEIQTVEGATNIDVHEMCRNEARTDFYYLIHPNTEIFDTFNFDYSFAFGLDKENQKVVVWQKENPQTGFVREYHGVGLFPKDGSMFKEREYAIFNFRRKAVYEKDPIARDLEFPVIRTKDMHNLNHSVDADMYWLVHEDVEDFTLEHYPFSYDREFIHNFKVRTSGGTEVRNGIRLVPANADTDKQKDVDQTIGTLKETKVIRSSTLKGGLNDLKTYPFIIVDPAVQLNDKFDFYPDLYDKASAHIFEKGVVFVASEYDEYNLKFHDTIAATVPEYDIFVYDSGNNTENVKQYKNYTILSGDIIEAHKQAQENSKFNYYYFITDDVDVSNFSFDYEFEFSMTEEGRQQIVVWQKTDFENSPLEYKGVGLFRKDYDLFTEKKYKNFDFRRKALYVVTDTVKPIQYPIVNKIEDVNTCGYEMAWVVDDCVENFTPNFVPPSYDKEYIHNFNVTTQTGAIARNHIRLVPCNYDEEKQKDIDKVFGNVKEFDVVLSSTLKGGIEQVKSYPTLVVDPAVELTNFDFYPDLYDEASLHVFSKGVVLLTKEYDEFNIKYHERTVSKTPEYDIFFWDRGFGKNNFAELQQRFPRIQNVTTDTLTELHELAQKKSEYNYYYVITSDTTVTDFNFDYEFEFSMTEEGRQQIVVWQKSDWENNALEYHGVGLFRKDYELFEERKYQRFDFRRKALYQHTTNIKPVCYDIVYTNDLINLSQVKKCDTEMVWLVDKNVFDEITDYVPPSYDKSYIHNFQVEIDNGTTVRNGVRLVPLNYNEEQQKDVELVLGNMSSFGIVYSSTLKSGLEQIEEYPAWIVDPALELNEDFSFYPDLFDEASAYIFNPGGVVFVTKEYDEFNVKFIEEEAATYPDYDIFYWDKGFGNTNFAELQERFPRIQKISTMHSLELHNYARDNSVHNYYYIVTPDTKVGDFSFDYKFEFSMTEEGRPQIVVWQRSNSDGEAREYYGVGLFRKDYEKFDEKQYAKFNFRRRALYIETKELTDVPFDVIRVSDLLDTTQAVNADTEMAWLVSDNVEFTQPEFSPFSYDRHYTHNFNITVGDATIRNGVRLVPRNDASEDSQKDIDTVAGKLQTIERVEARTVEEAVKLATQDTFWMVNPDLELTDKTVDKFYPDLYNMSPTHIFSFESRKGERMGHGGLALANKAYHPENVEYHNTIVARVPDRHNIKKYFTRDPYKAYKQSKKHVFYWVVDTAVDLVEDWDFDFYPDIHSIENVFAFKSEGDGESGVYLVHRPHLAEFNPSEEDFSFDRFKNIIRIDRVASRVVGHPAFFFDEGMYKANTEHFTEHKNIDVIDATDLATAYRKAADMTKTGYFWALDNDAEMIDDFERSFYVDRHHKSHFHLWPKENPYTGFVHQYGGLKLIPAAAIKELKPDADKLRKMTFKNKKPVKKATAATRDIPYDVVFLSYNEPFADQNYEKLLEKVPNAKRIHGVKGIFNAHKQAAELADTRMFYVVDADAILLEDFKFEYFPSVWDEDMVHTWKSKNPINDLIYGYGGLKLFPTKLLREAKDWRIDFTTSISEKFKPMPIAANYTAFNTDPFNTWKSAFRECTKLSSSIIHRNKQDEDDERLEAWCTKGADRDFGTYAVAGAQAGKAWGIEYADNDAMLGKINDFEWLQNKFKEYNND